MGSSRSELPLSTLPWITNYIIYFLRLIPPFPVSRGIGISPLIRLNYSFPLPPIHSSRLELFLTRLSILHGFLI